jgi:hypothetical protein
MSSGSTALAAAKNRRGNANIIKLTPNGANGANCAKNGGSCSVNNNRNIPKGEQEKPVLTPMQVLHLHEVRLSKIENLYKTLDSSVKTINDSNSNLLSTTSRNIQPVVASSVSNEEVNMLKERVALLEEMFEHLKEDIFRVQTFAMETNTTLMRIKNSVENSTSDTNTQALTIVDNDEDEQDNQETEFTVQDIKNLSR